MQCATVTDRADPASPARIDTMSKTNNISARSAASSADCVALARESRKCAQAFRQSVAAFDQINIAGILGSLQNMRASVQVS